MTDEAKTTPCPQCMGTGRSDYAGFAMDPCDPCGATGKAPAQPKHEPTPVADDLVPTMQRALPGGAMDDSTFDAIETALDRVEAPCRSPDGTRWLTLPERVLALAAELGRAPT